MIKARASGSKVYLYFMKKGRQARHRIPRNSCLCHYYDTSTPVLISVSLSLLWNFCPSTYQCFLCHYYGTSTPVLISVSLSLLWHFCPSSYQCFLCHFYDTSAAVLISGGWSGGAMVLGKLPVPVRPTCLDQSRARAYCSCSRCGWGLFGLFLLSSILSLLFLSLFGRRPDIDWNTVSKGR